MIRTLVDVSVLKKCLHNDLWKEKAWIEMGVIREYFLEEFLTEIV